MKPLLLSLLITSVLMASMPTTVQASNDAVYTIGVVPQFHSRKMVSIWKPILTLVEKKTGLKLKLAGPPSIQAFEKDFMAGEFDFAYMNPYHILLAHESEGYIPLIRDTGRALQGVLVVRHDDDINSVSDLNGKTFAFPAPNALGASLMIRAELTDAFKIDFSPEYVNTHTSVYLNVALGQAAAGGGVQNTFNRQSEDVRSVLKIIHRTAKVPPHPLVVHPRVPENVRQAITNAFLDLGKSEHGKMLLKKIPIKNIGQASIEEYLPLAEFKLNRFYQN